MIAPPWMQAVVPRITEQAAPVDPLAAILAELKALRDEVAGLRVELELSRKTSIVEDIGDPGAWPDAPSPAAMGSGADAAEELELVVDLDERTPEQARYLRSLEVSRVSNAEALEISSGYWNGSAT